LEDKFGGKRCPVISGSGSQFLPPVTPAIEIVVSFVAIPFIRKYLDGVLNGEALKELGEKHRETISSWFSKLENELETVVTVTNDLLKDYPKAVVCRRQETDFILEVDLDTKKLRAVLNKNHSTEARVKLPGSIVKAVRYIVENQTDQYLEEFKLHFDFQSKEWDLYATTPIKLSNEKLV